MKNYIRNNVSFDSLSTIFVQAPVALGFLKGENLIIEAANPQILEVWGKTDEVIGKPLIEGLPELEGQIFIDLLQEVLRTGEIYKGNKASVFLVRNGVYGECFFDFIYAPVFDPEEGKITGVSIVATEVSDQIEAQRRLDESNFRYKELLNNSDYSTAVYRGKDLVIEFANDEMVKTWGKDASVRGRKLEDAIPELKGQPFVSILKNILDTGVGYHAAEDRVDLVVDGRLQTFYFNFSYKPLKNPEGEVYAILNDAVNVTELVTSRKKALENEALLKSFMESVPMAVSVMEGPSYRIMISNDATTKIWGGNPNRIGMPIAVAYPGIEEMEIFQHLEKARKTKQRVMVKEHEINNEDGQHFVNFILNPLMDENGEVTHIISITYEVTEEMAVKKMLSENEQRFRSLANSMPQFVWTADKDGNIDFFNDKWYEYTHFDRSLSGNRNFEKVLHPDHLEKTKTLWAESIEKGRQFEMEYLFRDYDNPGNYRWFLGRAVQIKDSEGNAVQWVGTCTDIDEFKQLQKQKDSFLGIASHELKTPLTSLKLYAQFIEKNLRKEGDSKNAEVAKKMDVQINKLTSLITDLLDVTKIQNGKLQLNKTDFDVDQMIDDVVEEQQMNSRHKLTVEKEKIGTAFGDPHRISQVLTNLINNAIKYSPAAEEVLITVKKENENICFCVKDYGIGVSADNREKIFDQYYRVSGTKEHTFPGLGLGLFISSEIIKRSNGKIYVNDVEGAGTEVCFEIPVTDEPDTAVS